MPIQTWINFIFKFTIINSLRARGSLDVCEVHLSLPRLTAPHSRFTPPLHKLHKLHKTQPILHTGMNLCTVNSPAWLLIRPKKEDH